MADRIPRKPSARGGQTTRPGKGAGSGAGKKNGSKSKSGPSGSSKGGSTGSKPPVKSKNGGSPLKKGTGKPSRSKSKADRKVQKFWEKGKFYLLGLSLGLLLGALGAVLLLHWPEIHKRLEGKGAGSGAKTMREDRIPKVTKREAVQAEDKAAVPKTERRPLKTETTETRPQPGRLLYEEIQKFDRHIKKLDQILYATLQSMQVPEGDIDFVSVTHRQDGEHSWDHVLIEVHLPAELSPEEAGAKIAEALDRSKILPKPRLTASALDRGLALDIKAGPVSTHALRLLASLPSKDAPPVRPKVAIPDPAARPVKRPPAGLKPKVAIIIDDLGQDLNRARCFMTLNIPISVAILPFLTHSRQVASLARKQGIPVMLHLPMQPREWPGTNPGPGVLLLSMDQNETRRRVRAAIAAVPFAVGVNNHMGSRFTEEASHVGWVLDEIGGQGLFFVDSRTSGRSMVVSEARRRGVRCAQRTTFLDNDQEPRAIRIQIKKLVAKARQEGVAIGIGHVYPVTCQVLRSMSDYLASQVDLVPVTAIVR